MDIKTHEAIRPELCGRPVELGDGYARVELTTTEQMRADEHGLVHGGFVFALADYAAMLAVNHPNVVLGRAATRFLKPVVVGDRLEALARSASEEERRCRVDVEVSRAGAIVFTGEFVCYTPEEHVLERRRRGDGDGEA